MEAITLASLRDVLNHIGKAVIIEREGSVVVEVKGIERAGVAFIEPKVEPLVGDTLRFVESGRRFRIRSVAGEAVNAKVDHYRLDLETA